jgi:hypothetical protein
MAVMLTTMSRSELVVSEGRRELGQLEDKVAATGWMWDRSLSYQVDRLLVVLEPTRA